MKLTYNGRTRILNKITFNGMTLISHPCGGRKISSRILISVIFTIIWSFGAVGFPNILIQSGARRCDVASAIISHELTQQNHVSCFQSSDAVIPNDPLFR